MGTRGWIIFKYKGKHYVFYNHWDSYPEKPCGLGSRLIDDLKKYNHEQLIELLNTCVINIGDIKDNDENGGEHFSSIELMLKNPLNYVFNVYNILQVLAKDIFIEYKYIINLDEELFTMTNEWNNIQLHFPLFNIPDDWYETYCKVIDAYSVEE